MSELPNHSRLSNLGNTCYINGVLHPLSHTPGGFIEYILSGEYLATMKEEKTREEIYETLMFQYHRILNSMFKSRTTELSIHSWKKIIGEKNVFFEGSEQQDAQEFLSFIIDKFIEEVGLSYDFLPRMKFDSHSWSMKKRILNIQGDNSWERFHKKKYSLLVPMFSGLFRTKLTFKDSGAVSNSFAPFNILNMQIKKSDDDEVELTDCIKQMFREEELDKDNLISGKRSYGKTLGLKCESLWRLPKYLIIQLKRFSYNDYGQMTTKDNTLVKYPLELDMKEYIDEDSKFRELENKYYLYGVTLHHGMMMGGFSAGHYVAFVRNRGDKKWYLYNDDDTPRLISNKELVNNKAYLLYYCRKDC